jgi:GntP family gluconate:H+ symporter
MGTALAAGLIITHHLVPPTPGPLGVAGIFGADVGMVILWGIAFSIPLVLVGIAYAKYNGRKIYQIPSDDGLSWERPDEIQEEELKELNIEEMFPNLDKMPGMAVSFAPIIVPIILIFLNTLTAALGVEGMASQIFTFIGSPTIAVAIGLILAIYTLAGNEKREDVLNQMEEGVASAGIILLITGAGGAFGYIIRSTGIGDYLAQVIAGLPIPAILIPFAIATVIRLIQGSGTVSMITAASISAPILSTLNVSPVFATISACMGAMVFSYFNDSFFWVVNRMMGITDVKEQIKTWSVPTTIIWGVGGVLVLIVNAIFG